MHAAEGPGPSHYVTPKKSKVKGKMVGQRESGESTAATQAPPPAPDVAHPSGTRSGTGRGLGSVLRAEEEEPEREVVEYGDGDSDPPSEDQQVTDDAALTIMSLRHLY